VHQYLLKVLDVAGDLPLLREVLNRLQVRGFVFDAAVGAPAVVRVLHCGELGTEVKAPFLRFYGIRADLREKGKGTPALVVQAFERAVAALQAEATRVSQQQPGTVYAESMSLLQADSKDPSFKNKVQYSKGRILLTHTAPLQQASSQGGVRFQYELPSGSAAVHPSGVWQVVLPVAAVLPLLSAVDWEQLLQLGPGHREHLQDKKLHKTLIKLLNPPSVVPVSLGAAVARLQP
jgi:hypothetical protein